MHMTVDIEDQHGFTLIEALVVMIVGVVILAAAAAGIGKLLRSSEISETASDIMQISANIRNLRGAAHGYEYLNNMVAKRYKAIPANMSQDASTDTITNLWGGDVLIGPDADNNEAFFILYTQVPAEACQQLTLKLRGASWSSVTAGHTLITPKSSLETIGDACGTAPTTLQFVSS
jgi:prepilin-type N-terminal cleavage/methylation domain-containing protein